MTRMRVGISGESPSSAASLRRLRAGSRSVHGKQVPSTWKSATSSSRWSPTAEDQSRAAGSASPLVGDEETDGVSARRVRDGDRTDQRGARWLLRLQGTACATPRLARRSPSSRRLGRDGGCPRRLDAERGLGARAWPKHDRRTDCALCRPQRQRQRQPPFRRYLSPLCWLRHPGGGFMWL
jgi:hypothetical protein